MTITRRYLVPSHRSIRLRAPDRSGAEQLINHRSCIFGVPAASEAGVAVTVSLARATVSLIVLYREFGRLPFHTITRRYLVPFPSVDQVTGAASSKRPHREIESTWRNWLQHKLEYAETVLHDGNHRCGRRRSCAVITRLDRVRRRAFFRRNSCNATALLCCVSCEL